MRSAGPTSSTALPPPPRPQVIKTHQQQVLLYVVLTQLLSPATVWAGRTWLQNSEMNAIDEAKALTRIFPGVSDETLTSGALVLRLTSRPSSRRTPA